MEPDNDYDDDETFRALQQLLNSMTKAKTPSTFTIATTNNNNHTNSCHCAPMTSVTRDDLPNLTPSASMSKEKQLEQRRKEREKAKTLLIAKSEQQRRQQRRLRTTLSSSFCDNISDNNDEEDDEPRRSVESTICERLTSGSFTRFSVSMLSRERWSMEEEERLPIVCPPRHRPMVSPADNPQLNVYPTRESLVLQQALHELHEADPSSKFLTPPRSTWSFQLHSLSPHEQRRKHL